MTDKVKTFKNSNNASTLLIAFSETGATAFFKYPMHQLFGKCFLLDSFILYSQINIIVQQLRDAATDIDRLKVIENFLISRLTPKVKRVLISLAVELIKEYAGNIKITMLAERLKISQSQLEKRFRKIVGASPKKFASIVRVRNVISVASNESNMTRLGLEAGYFDQAHFIKDFKSFTDFTPKRYFKRK